MHLIWRHRSHASFEEYDLYIDYLERHIVTLGSSKFLGEHEFQTSGCCMHGTYIHSTTVKLAHLLNSSFSTYMSLLCASNITVTCIQADWLYFVCAFNSQQI